MNIKTLKTAATALFFLGLQNAFAQSFVQHSNSMEGSPCGTEAPGQQWESQFQELIKETKADQSANKSQAILYTIPVIIHVIHGGQPVGTYPNLAQGQINSQITVLNQDFGGTGYKSNNYPSTAFAAWATAQGIPSANLDGQGRVKIANCYVQFCLATKDSVGNLLPEPGIDRINYVSRGWSNPGAFPTTTALKNFIDNTVKPQTIWNVSKYLNVWITDNDINSNNLLGYATFPYLTGLSGIPGTTGSNTKDGFWCYSKAFGSKTIYASGTYFNGYQRGRTSTHEIGHWLGLRHIGGDGNNNPAGDCNATDYCADTPPQKGGLNTGQYGQNFGSPSYPLFANVCSGAVNGNMFMNFMDYTDDDAKYMYTTDQATRIQTAMANSPYRKFLGTHNLCSVSSVPAVSQFNIPSSVCESAVITTTNTSSGSPPPTYTWSSNGGAVFSPNINSSVTSVSFPVPGTYVLTLASSNGTLSTQSKTITVNPNPSIFVSSSSQVICLNDSVGLTASGALSYVWYPGSMTGSNLSFIALADQTITCVGTGPGGCTGMDTVSVLVSECTGIQKTNAVKAGFTVYPNPAHSSLYLRSDLEEDAQVAVELLDLTGKVFLQESIHFNSDTKQKELSISGLSNGIYILKLKTNKGETQVIKLVKE